MEKKRKELKRREMKRNQSLFLFFTKLVKHEKKWYFFPFSHFFCVIKDAKQKPRDFASSEMEFFEDIFMDYGEELFLASLYSGLVKL